MSVLICDTDGELWYTRLEELQMDCISMPYFVNGQEFFYDSGKNTDFKKFFDEIRQGQMPTTMALNPQQYTDILEPYFAQGEDVLYVSFGHKMSGTFGHLETAMKDLKAKYPTCKLTVFDTASICLGAGIQMEYAGELKRNGATDDEIIQFLKQFTNRSCMYFVVDDLMHLKRGGRLSGIAAFAGTLLSLKPMLTIDDKGSLAVVEKITGKRKALHALADKVIADLTGTEYRVYVLDADDAESGDLVASMIAEKRPEAQIVRQTVGPVIGAHCGPGTVGVIFIGDKRPIALASQDNVTVY